jgi:hypothetical protein
MKLRMIVMTAALLAAPMLMNAQTNSQINQRKFDQQHRIHQGVRSGQLTHRETAHLERQEHAINHEEHAMRAQDNGHLTGQDRRVINRQQNVESARIYRDKHNGLVR